MSERSDVNEVLGVQGSGAMTASTRGGDHPRPQFERDVWQSLDGVWEFGFDDDDIGVREAWHEPGRGQLASAIRVPFPPESAASMVADPGFHPVVWYRRTFRFFAAAGRRAVLHFGAVDQHATVWLNGQRVTQHSGGQTAFCVDVTEALSPSGDQVVVVRAVDDPHDSELPRGKQDWRLEPHVVWYHRTTGIWRSVWLEEVPDAHLESADWDFDLRSGSLGYTLNLSAAAVGLTARIVLAHDGQVLSAVDVAATTSRLSGRVEISALRNAQERDRLLWTPENPVLVDVDLELRDAEGEAVDRVSSYVGLRTVEVDRGRFMLNGRPYFVRSVLEQGYWPESHLAPPSPQHLREEIELIKSLGFNAARIHQKTEDPRFHYWADRLGVLLWVETAAAYEFTPRAAAALISDWMEIVKQYRNHPSVVTWVPVNESWGVQDLSWRHDQQAFVQAITSLTRALDPSRPVVSNDGWEHVDSDILTIHDYSTDPAVLSRHYATRGSIDEMIRGLGPEAKRLILDPAPTGRAVAAPVMVTEFGGISYAAETTWGYGVVESDEEYEAILDALFDALNASPALAGFCYTQLTDTRQEANGLVRSDRTPKIPADRVRRAVMGLQVEPEGTSRHDS